MVEDLIQMRLKSHLSLFRIRVKSQFKGYDLGAYVDDPSSADVGSIEVQQAETLLAKIEIKATRGKAVTLRIVGATSLSSSSPLALIPYSKCVKPVAFPPGCAGMIWRSGAGSLSRPYAPHGKAPPGAQRLQSR